MREVVKMIKCIGTVGLVLAVASALLVAPSAMVRAGEEVSEYIERARIDAQKARADAEKAMAEAEKAIAEADKAIAEAEKAKFQAREDKAKALEKMVDAHYYPDDIELHTPESKTVAVFSHKKHTERERLRCIECHPRVFIMKVGKNVVKKGQLTMAEMKKGKYCGNCHNGHKAFSVTSIKACKKCHPK